MKNRWKAELDGTYYAPDDIPAESFPEIAFAGRSNVGKSTLINALLDRKIAQVSSTPGKTRSINRYRITAKKPFFLVDLPGFGYARRSKKERDRWNDLITGYLLERTSLEILVHLVDFRHGMLENDRQLQKMCADRDIPVQVLFTKADKISRGKHNPLVRAYISKGLRSLYDPVPVSAEKQFGVDETARLLENHLDLLPDELWKTGRIAER